MIISTLVPSFLSDISPKHLRNDTGLFHSIFLSFGLFLSQIAGFSQIIYGKYYILLWNIDFISSICKSESFKELNRDTDKIDEPNKAIWKKGWSVVYQRPLNI